MGELIIENINRERLSDSVSRKLTGLIVERALKPGDPLPSEAKLSDRFGVSKPVIREALRGLAGRGIIEIQQGKVATVCAPTAQPLESFFLFAMGNTKEGLREAVELRRLLETEIAQLAAKRITDEEVSDLERCVLKMKEKLGTVDPWVDADLEFHHRIAEIAKNNLMLYLVKALSNLFRESMLLMHIQRGPDKAYATFVRHCKIFEAFRARDPELAKQAMKAHFDATEPVILEIIHSGRRFSA